MDSSSAVECSRTVRIITRTSLNATSHCSKSSSNVTQHKLFACKAFTCELLTAELSTIRDTGLSGQEVTLTSFLRGELAPTGSTQGPMTEGNPGHMTPYCLGYLG